MKIITGIKITPKEQKVLEDAMDFFEELSKHADKMDDYQLEFSNFVVSVDDCEEIVNLCNSILAECEGECLL